MSKHYSLTSDLFNVPYKGKDSILYAPRRGFVCVANPDLISLLADLDSLEKDTLNSEQKTALEYLETKGVINGPEEFSCVKPVSEEYLPTHITLFPTNQCNLRCIYCYASAGDLNPKIMDWHYATNAIDITIENLKKQNSKHMSLGFHGGGEPLYPWEFIKKVVSYAEERAEKEELNLNAYAATNGILNEKQLEWIIKHFSNLNISFDGLPHVQNHHRPLPDGKGSFESIDRTMHFLDEHNFSYGIRSTISSYNVGLMDESIHYIGQNYKSKYVHFEPLFNCGRCKKDDKLAPDLKAFYEGFCKCDKLCEPYEIAFTYSGCKFENLSNSFCGVTRDNFSVTPDGYITTCFEVITKDDPRSEIFFIGRIRDDGTLDIDVKKRQYLLSLTVENLEYCNDCFAKWHCAGDCLAKIETSNYTKERGHDRCELNRRLIKNRLINLVEGTYYHPNMRKGIQNQNQSKQIEKEK